MSAKIMKTEDANYQITLLNACLEDILSVLMDDDNRIASKDYEEGIITVEQELKLLKSTIDAQRTIRDLAEAANLVIER